MPATALLTTVFLQLSSMDAVGQTSVLVLMDKIYGLGFAIVFIVIARVIWETFQVFHHKRESHPYVRFDRSLAIVLACAFALFATQSQAAARWIGSWAAPPAPPMENAPSSKPAP